MLAVITVTILYSVLLHAIYIVTLVLGLHRVRIAIVVYCVRSYQSCIILNNESPCVVNINIICIMYLKT